MGSEKRGNLANVRDELRVGMVVDYVDLSAVDYRSAQIVPAASPMWFVVEIANREVEAELIKRRFGIYVPECEERIVRCGRTIDRRTSLFPGYVFVFMWSTAENWGLLANTPAVVSVLGTVPEEAIDRIRYLENCWRPITVEWFEEVRKVPHKRKRRRKRREKIMVPDEIVNVRTWSAFHDVLPTLDSEGRNQALRQMCSSSQQPSANGRGSES